MRLGTSVEQYVDQSHVLLFNGHFPTASGKSHVKEKNNWALFSAHVSMFSPWPTSVEWKWTK